MRIYMVISSSFFSPQSFHVSINIQVLCVVGDVSFLHDTNGLAILNQRYENERNKYLLVLCYDRFCFILQTEKPNGF